MLPLAVLSLAAAAGTADEASWLAAARHILASAEHISVYSLDPSNESRWGEDGKCIEPCFVGYPRLGHTPPISEPERVAVVQELRTWLDAPEPEAATLCYIPRHGVTVRSGKTSLEFLLCYECGHGEVRITGSAQHATHLYRFGDVRVLDEVLARHGVPLPPAGDG